MVSEIYGWPFPFIKGDQPGKLDDADNVITITYFKRTGQGAHISLHPRSPTNESSDALADAFASHSSRNEVLILSLSRAKTYDVVDACSNYYPPPPLNNKFLPFLSIRRTIFD